MGSNHQSALFVVRILNTCRIEYILIYISGTGIIGEFVSAHSVSFVKRWRTRYGL